MVAHRLRGTLLLVLLLAFLLTLPVHAATATADPFGGAGAGIENEYRHFIDSIPGEITDKLPNGMLPEGERTNFGDVAQAVSEISGVSYLLDVIGNLLSVEWGTAWRVLAQIVGLLLLSAVSGALRRSFHSETVDRIVSLGVTCAIFATILGTLYGQLQKVSQFLTGLNALVNALLPLMAALHVMGGNIAVAAVQNSSLLFFLSICENVCNRTVIPMTGICLSLTLTSVLSPGLSLKGLTKLIKDTYAKTLGFVMLLLSFVLSTQTLLRAASDSLAARAAKFLAGNLIPVVGGAVGDTLRTVASGVAFLKSTVGIGAMIVLFLMVLPVLISLLLTRLSFRLSLAVADLLGCETESRILTELVGIYGTLIAVISICTVLLIFALTLFVRVSAA